MSELFVRPPGIPSVQSVLATLHADGFRPEDSVFKRFELVHGRLIGIAAGRRHRAVAQLPTPSEWTQANKYFVNHDREGRAGQGVTFWIPIIFAVLAVLYASVGQAGGTGYIAAMGLLGLAPDVIKPTALTLNVLVAAIGCVRFYRAGLLTWRSAYPFGILGAPFSVLGGATNLPASVYQPVVGLLLLLAAVQMVRSAGSAASTDLRTPQEPPFIPSLVAGGAIGFVSGITGVGGGIFLAPLMLTLGWVATRQSAAVSTVFNLLNSSAALAGVWATIPALPAELPVWLVAVGVGGLTGSWIGALRLPPKALRYILAILLVAAGVRMMLW